MLAVAANRAEGRENVATLTQARSERLRQSGPQRLGVFLHTLQAVLVRDPSGDFATGVECE